MTVVRADLNLPDFGVALSTSRMGRMLGGGNTVSNTPRGGVEKGTTVWGQSLVITPEVFFPFSHFQFQTA